MKKFYVILSLAVLVAAFSRCHKADIFPDSGYDPRLSGGAATIFDASSHAFSVPMDGLDARNTVIHNTGDNTFGQTFVAPPAPHFEGLGPVYNNNSCVNCHSGDGEGSPITGLSGSGMLMRVSLRGMDAHGGPLPVPGFGTQIQDQSVFGAAPEATLNIGYTNLPVTYPDGSVVNLRQPSYQLQNSYLPLPADCLMSARMAPPLVGMSLLENIPESTILSFVDAKDANGDGITGQANYVYDSYTGKTELGRFGAKANTPTLLMQVATAYQQDMGITSYVLPEESCAGQVQMNAVNGDVEPELADSLLNDVVYYVQTLGVPARRNTTDPDVQAGEALFTQINCSGCHRPTVQTGIDITFPQISNQRIHPYTDLLLHDMGQALADNRQDYLATGTQWRTMPLWGIGLLPLSNGIPYYLHDGRARTLEEAILWHGGEATNAKNAFMQLNAAGRAQILKFLSSL
jgi:CxxC motif-containing protein (DUF1111 family)